MKQSAVQWLQQSLSLTFEQEMQFEGLFQQAKEMEKQQERSYSEEDMRKAFEFYAERAICDIKYLDDDFNEFIKQFKKK